MPTKLACVAGLAGLPGQRRHPPEHSMGAVVGVALILLARWKTEAKLQFFASIFHLDGRVDAVELRSVGLE